MSGNKHNDYCWIFLKAWTEASDYSLKLIQDSEPHLGLLRATRDSGQHQQDLCFLFRGKQSTANRFPRFLCPGYSKTKFTFGFLMYLIPELTVVTFTQEWEYVLE